MSGLTDQEWSDLRHLMYDDAEATMGDLKGAVNGLLASRAARAVSEDALAEALMGCGVWVHYAQDAEWEGHVIKAPIEELATYLAARLTPTPTGDAPPPTEPPPPLEVPDDAPTGDALAPLGGGTDA